MTNSVARIAHSVTQRAGKLLIILLFVSILVNIILVVFAIPGAYWFYNNGAPQLFSLNDPRATYTLRKPNDGTYRIYWQINGGYKPTREAAFNEFGASVGSTQVPLDPFVGRQVKVIGNFRPIFGSPTCWKKCQFDAGVSDRQIVIDVKDIQLVQ